MRESSREREGTGQGVMTRGDKGEEGVRGGGQDSPQEQGGKPEQGAGATAHHIVQHSATQYFHTFISVPLPSLC
jgi:hypothetical protein